MTLLAGYAPDGDSSGTVHLATLLARSSGEPLVICAVIPSPPPPGMARVDRRIPPAVASRSRSGAGESAGRHALRTSM